MLAYLDTEFTDLVVQPRLLSVGIVAARKDDNEFYAEVTDVDRIRATNWFGLDAVLPQFGKVEEAACTYLQLGRRLSDFLGDLLADLREGELLELAFGYHLDWELIDRAATDSGSKSWDTNRRRIRPLNVHEVSGAALGRLAADAYFKTQALAPLSRHHALCDARALRYACEAVLAANAASPRAAVLANRRS